MSVIKREPKGKVLEQVEKGKTIVLIRRREDVYEKRGFGWYPLQVGNNYMLFVDGKLYSRGPVQEITQMVTECIEDVA